MANERELKLKITGDSSAAEKAVARLEAALERAERELTKAKEAAEDSSGRVEAVGAAADSTAADLDKLADDAEAAADSVEQVSDAADPAADAVEQLGRAFKVFGVSSEAGAAGLRQLAKAAETSPEKFKDLGVQIVRTEDDAVDLVETTKRLADRFQKIKDPAERAAMASALLGDRWQDLEPMLARGSRGIDAASSSLDRLGHKAGEVARDHLGPVGDALDALGLSLDNVDPKVVLTATALGGIAAVLGSGIEKWGEYTHQVRQYSDAANIGTEEASRFASVFKQFGVEADDGIDALKTLAEEAGDAPEKFAKYGIEIVRAKDGSVDLSKTLQAVADRFRQTQDPTQRAAMGAALFGDNWLRIAPILERGSDGIAELLANVDESAIVTSKAMREQREFEQATRELKTTWDELSMAMARDAIPRLTQMADDLSTVTEATEGMTGGVFGLSDAMNLFNPIALAYDVRLRSAEDAARAAAWSAEDMGSKVATAALKAGDAANKAADLAAAEQAAADKAEILKSRQEDVARSAEDAARGVEEHRRQLDLLNGAVQTVAGTKIAYERATMGVADAEQNLAEKQKAATDAVNEFGSESPEARKANDDYAKSLLDAQSAADQQAKAAVNLARETATAAGQSFTAEQANIVYRDALNKVRDASNDPNLKAGLGGLIGLVDDTARAAGDAETKLDAAEAAARRLAAVAAGVGTTTNGMIVGSADRMERAITRQSSAPAAAPSSSTTINVQAQTNANPWDIAASVDWALRTGGR